MTCWCFFCVINGFAKYNKHFLSVWCCSAFFVKPLCAHDSDIRKDQNGLLPLKENGFRSTRHTLWRENLEPLFDWCSLSLFQVTRTKNTYKLDNPKLILSYRPFSIVVYISTCVLCTLHKIACGWNKGKEKNSWKTTSMLYICTYYSLYTLLHRAKRYSMMLEVHEKGAKKYK